jgi:hypothetical protein
MTGRDGLANQLRIQGERMLEIQAALENTKSQNVENFLRGELDPTGTLSHEKMTLMSQKLVGAKWSMK